MSEVVLISGMLGKPIDVEGLPGIATGKGESGVVVYGPYEHRAPGRYAVSFTIGLADNVPPVGDAIAATVEVFTNDGLTLIAQRHILHSHLGNGVDRVVLPFALKEPRIIEYRVQSSGQVALKIATKVSVAEVAKPRDRRPARGTQLRSWENEREFLDGYLRNISGVIHVGANLGQERRYYWLIGVDVLWVEPILEVYQKMVDNITPYPRQRAINALLTARSGEQVSLGIANNNGASSSVLPLEDHKTLFPGVEYLEHRMLTSSTLQTLVEREGIDLDDYQALTLDTEGAELMILQGAGDMLKRFQYIKCEVADFPARTGTPSTRDLDALLQGLGFKQLARRPFATGPNGAGTYWDIVWKRTEPGEPLHEPGFLLPLVMSAGEVEDIEKCE